MRAHSDIRKASGFVVTMEPLGFVLTKGVNVFLLRVHSSNSVMVSSLHNQFFSYYKYFPLPVEDGKKVRKIVPKYPPGGIIVQHHFFGFSPAVKIHDWIGLWKKA